VLPRVGALKLRELVLPRVGSLKIRELVLPVDPRGVHLIVEKHVMRYN
jgi:hypothetical protein